MESFFGVNGSYFDPIKGVLIFPAGVQPLSGKVSCVVSTESEQREVECLGDFYQAMVLCDDSSTFCYRTPL